MMQKKHPGAEFRYITGVLENLSKFNNYETRHMLESDVVR